MADMRDLKALQERASLRRGTLTCYRYADNGHLGPCINWYVMGTKGAVSLTALLVRGHLEPLIIQTHTPRSSSDEFPTVPSCPFLDGVACYGDASGMEAMYTITRALRLDDEEVVWGALIDWYENVLTRGTDHA